MRVHVELRGYFVISATGTPMTNLERSDFLAMPTPTVSIYPETDCMRAEKDTLDHCSLR